MGRGFKAVTQKAAAWQNIPADKSHPARPCTLAIGTHGLRQLGPEASLRHALHTQSSYTPTSVCGLLGVMVRPMRQPRAARYVMMPLTW